MVPRLGGPARSCWLVALPGDVQMTRAFAEDLRAVAERHHLGNFAMSAHFFTHWSAACAGGTTEDLDAMQVAVDGYAATGTTLNLTGFLALLARACGELGQIDRGLEALEASLDMARRSGELVFQAEAWRVKGALLRSRATKGEDAAQDLAAARACLETAIRVARDQGAVAIERWAAEELTKT